MPDEALRVLAAARHANLLLRLVGGLAVHFSVADSASLLLPREYKDIDFAAPDGHNRQLSGMMAELGYSVPAEFNALNGARRLMFFDETHSRQVDIFIGAFVMCHVIPLASRLEVNPRTVPLAELLLTKLQIVELNAKDQTDIVNLLYHHELAPDDEAGINVGRVAELCARDWGLWRTVRLNLERTADATATLSLPVHSRRIVQDRLKRLDTHLETARKGIRWRLRNRIGDRLRWYEEPEEVD